MSLIEASDDACSKKFFIHNTDGRCKCCQNQTYDLSNPKGPYSGWSTYENEQVNNDEFCSGLGCDGYRGTQTKTRGGKTC